MLSCSRPECHRAAGWQAILHVPVVRAGASDVVSVPMPLLFCDDHRLSESTQRKLKSSERFRRALAHRLEREGWQPRTEYGWVERTRIVADHA